MSSRKRKHKEKDHSTSSTDSSSEDEKRKEKKRRKKEKKRLKKEKRKKMRKENKKSKTSADSDVSSSGLKEAVSQQGKDRGRMCPMTKEEWEKQQSVVRRVYDEETGRSRLIKGDGEVLEEIVSKSRHQEINRKATMGDGMSFQSKLGLLKK
uniref:ADP-ribosylation factor-like protein 6-interacting protein 4 n=1 Tax=Styela clava TaxID=7725 RepID=UPI00193936BA|nr:ADP-ribosylation factor-like protein 6-interacting protein 4 [Styela clava]